MKEEIRKLQEGKITMKEYLNIEPGLSVTIVPDPSFDEPAKVDTGMMSQKQKAQFLSYMEESFKEAKKNGR